MKIASTSQMKEIDRIAIEEHGIPSLELMEKAAASVFNKLVKLGCKSGKTAVVVCGTGNNGGDGLACARMLGSTGVETRVFMVGDFAKRTKDSMANSILLEQNGIEIIPFDGQNFAGCDYLIDALFGVGLNREITGAYKTAIEKINSSGACIVSCDIPSGINGDTGEVLGCAVKADFTITFSCMKPGMLIGAGAEHAGVVEVADIGIPDEIIENVIPDGRTNSVLVPDMQNKTD